MATNARKALLDGSCRERLHVFQCVRRRPAGQNSANKASEIIVPLGGFLCFAVFAIFVPTTQQKSDARSGDAAEGSKPEQPASHFHSRSLWIFFALCCWVTACGESPKVRVTTWNRRNTHRQRNAARAYSLCGILMVDPPMNSRISASPGMMSVLSTTSRERPSTESISCLTRR
jgi:hypothetical protein